MVGVPVFAPTATVEIDCDAGSADVVFDNSGSTVQAKYEVNVTTVMSRKTTESNHSRETRLSTHMT